MNKTSLATFFVAVLLISTTTEGQKKDTQNEATKNMGKLNLSSIALKSIGLQYERQIGKQTTVALGVSFQPTSTVAFKSQLEKIIDNPRINVDQFKLGTTVITPEFRYYFGKDGAYHGFYVAPYLRLGKYHVEGPVSYKSSTDSTKIAVFNGDLSFFSGGILLGSSFKLGGNFYLDWWIVGGSIGAASGNVHADSDLSDPDDRKTLKKELDGTNVPLTHIESVVTPTGATVTSSGSVVGIRGLGINVGFRF